MNYYYKQQYWPDGDSTLMVAQDRLQFVGGDVFCLHQLNDLVIRQYIRPSLV